MQDPMFSVEAIDAAMDYNRKCEEAMAEIMKEDVNFYIDELDKANKKIDQLYHFIEMTEALTYDAATAKRISLFLKEEGIWESLQKN